VLGKGAGVVECLLTHETLNYRPVSSSAWRSWRTNSSS